MPESDILPVYLLLPGLTGTGAFYRDLSTALQGFAEPRVITYPPEQVLSYEALAEFVLPAVPSDRPYALIAESFASPLAILLATKARIKPTHLILTAAFARNPWPATAWLRSLFLPFISARILPPPLIAHVLLGPRTLHLAVEVQAELRKLDPAVLQNRIRSVLTCDVRETFRSLDLPILYLQAAHDRLIPASCAAIMQDLQPAMTIRRVDTAHFVLQDRAASLARNVILPFLTSRPARSPACAASVGSR